MERCKTIAEIDLKALTHNLSLVKKKTGNSHVLAVVKADAYGHGALTISQHLLHQGAASLGVAFTREAIALREEGITAPILVFFDQENIDAWLTHDLTPVILSYQSAKRLSEEANKQDRTIPVHIKVDTGMGRVGMDPTTALKEIPKIAALKNIRIEGLMSHFSEADLLDKHFAEYQIEQFVSTDAALKKMNITVPFRHMANSAAVLTLPNAHFEMVRPGIMLYGYGCCEKKKLKPVLTLKSRPVFIKKVPPGTSISYGRTFVTKRDSIIATIPIGYADGYDRKLSNNGEVLIRNRRAPVVGRVCMDTIMVDVTDIPGVSLKSEVVLIGKQGKEKITADDIAERTGTIPYEVLTSIGQRVKRIYK